MVPKGRENNCAKTAAITINIGRTSNYDAIYNLKNRN
jgi:hypothetical protein